MSTVRWVLVGILAVAIAGCGGKRLREPDGGKLDLLASSPIVPGLGWGSLLLGKTRFREFVEKYGAAHPSLLFGDECGLELRYRGGQVSLLFMAEGDCDARFKAEGSQFGPLVGNGAKAFLAQYPMCAEMPLHSITLAAGKSKKETFYKGATPVGVRLFDDWITAKENYREREPRGAQMVAGGPEPQTARVHRQPGLWLISDPDPLDSAQRNRTTMRRNPPPSVHGIVIYRQKPSSSPSPIQ